MPFTKEQKKAYRQSHPEYFQKYREEHREEQKIYRQTHKDKHNEQNREYYQKRKKQVMDHYEWKCTCCGEEEPIFLSVDHIDGGGSKHRRELKGKDIYQWLIKNNFPPNFRTLCYNCNCGRRLNNGMCPHEQKR